MIDNKITSSLLKNLKAKNKKLFQKSLDELQPYDITREYESMSEEYKNKFLKFLTIEQLTNFL